MMLYGAFALNILSDKCTHSPIPQVAVLLMDLREKMECLLQVSRYNAY